MMNTVTLNRCGIRVYERRTKQIAAEIFAGLNHNGKAEFKTVKTIVAHAWSVGEPRGFRHRRSKPHKRPRARRSDVNRIQSMEVSK